MLPIKARATSILYQDVAWPISTRGLAASEVDLTRWTPEVNTRICSRHYGEIREQGRKLRNFHKLKNKAPVLKDSGWALLEGDGN
jgi:hypothetical protein